MIFDWQKATAEEQDFINNVWEKLDKKLSVISERSREKIPYTTIHGVHDNLCEEDALHGEKITWWTNGFWPGLMWLMYYGTKKETYKLTAEKAEELLDGAFEQFFGLHHDVGFMWHLSAGVNYRITGNQKSRIRAMYAASILASRYHPTGQFIRAWDGKFCVTIIDSMMNIPLLYWASRETGDSRFKTIAMNHADTTMNHHVRPDGSVKHIVEHNQDTGEYVREIGGQGYGEHSSWSRGQAWAIHGFILSYIHTGKQEYLDTAKRIAHYFIACICDDYMPRADFRAPKEPTIYDNTAAACAACGLLEIARNVPEFEGKVYYQAAIKLLKVLDEKFCNYDLNEDSIIQKGSELWTDDKEAMGKTVHIPIIYGDYYFAEAIYKLKGFDLLFE